MDQPAPSIKTRIEKEVLDVIIDGLRSGDLSVDNAREVAHQTLTTLERIEKHEESLIDFYKNLAQKYPVFSLLYTRIKDEIVKAKELGAHRQALAAIDAGNIDEAHKIASMAINQSAHEATNN
ncbi:hypothetical protein A2W45_01420 [Candidatus Curtissbacteria bacterium RIFCSPHIGHO2_12_41_11]|uniref:Uncharacterized protein n=3 Tax=Candidatus Curtissiibacteriota TaxID=1752717 RepID=A0A1F5HT97_9BACT|nr:MAG: hypothetical protein UU56_C0008G0018 [Candidatus Curtissbacteria bacterium GW2011_GWA2_41_24]OGD97979.1 MAG: hypothetical protein A2W45_01420 [Candidatus Curtissbacteria bacterium RIFCSPHIGHO2_12_41_11]OGE07431.1 MAG: hypothetical protein A2W70_03500 [Candidatus Curtissbacteria bacterium RIFCSPLOWO2_02_41_11]